ncbi:FRG domain-containing protein [Paenibacillus amylolyticus]|uniref:FRG domain-containing protein n=1 Tax=Paenibacillus amylolyticus TaxID=1451 RepID=UPI000FDBE29B|nr:FRG domain-containing protein [Paenibacillus amylolyticus]
MVSYDQVVETVHVNSAKELFGIISPFDERYRLLSNAYIFRGQKSAKYSLLPTALRLDKQSELSKYADQIDPISGDGIVSEYEFFQRANELKILYEFFVKSDNVGLNIPHVETLRNSMFFFLDNLSIVREWLPSSFHELAGLAQHYGLPTRLLDWSRDPFVSLYFASRDALKHGECDPDDCMVLWVLNRSVIEYYRNYGIPLEIINPPYSGNPNLNAQKGLFTHWKSQSLGENNDINKSIKVDRRPLDSLIYEYLSKEKGFFLRPEICMYKFLIPTKEAGSIFEALKRMNYDAAKIFPGFDGISRSIREGALVQNYY